MHSRMNVIWITALALGSLALGLGFAERWDAAMSVGLIVVPLVFFALGYHNGVSDRKISVENGEDRSNG